MCMRGVLFSVWGLDSREQIFDALVDYGYPGCHLRWENILPRPLGDIYDTLEQRPIHPLNLGLELPPVKPTTHG